MADQTLELPEQNPHLGSRFRGFLPVVIDIETGGFNYERHAVLEIAIVTLHMQENGLLRPYRTYFEHIIPHPDTEITQSSLEFTKIDPYHPFRFAISEKDALKKIFSTIKQHLKKAKCQKAILVAHNAIFDMSFLQAVIKRNDIKANPFHPFSVIDTASLSAVFLGQTVLARAVQAAGIPYYPAQAHSAIYDAEITASLFCEITNQWLLKKGWNKVDNHPIFINEI